MTLRSLFAAILITLGLGAGPIVLSAAPAAGKAETELKAAQQARFEAQVRNDIGALRRMLADDVTYTHSSGIYQNKTEYLADLEKGVSRYRGIELLEQQVRVYGDTGLITGKVHLTVERSGSTSSFDMRFTEVQLRRDGRWQLVAWESTLTK